MAKGNNRTRKRNAASKGAGSNEMGTTSFPNRGARPDRTADGSKGSHLALFKADVMPNFNDYAWYNRNPALAEAAARIPFPYRPGMALPNVFTTPASSGAVAQYVLPGVLALNWIPSIGQAAVATDPINIAAKEVYARVRREFSGSIEADPPDFMVYFVCLDSIFCYIAALKRVYRALTRYDKDNMNMPFVLLRAFGLSATAAQNLQLMKTRLWGVINTLVGMTRKFRCPNLFPYFARHYWLSDNVYGDDKLMNAQFYVFTQQAYYKYALKNTPDGVPAGGAELVQHPFGGTNVTPDSLLEFGRSLIDALAESDDAYLISGYLMRAYKDAAEFFVDELPEDQALTPVYDEAVLAQIQNSMTPLNLGGGTTFGTAYDISQNPKTNCVLCAPWANATSDTYNGILLNLRAPIPAVPEVIEATRLVTYLVAPVTGTQASILSGSEILTGYVLVTADAQGGSTAAAFPSVLVGSNGAPSWVYLQYIAKLAQFDWAPGMYYIRPGATETAAATLYPFVEWHNVTTVTEEQLSQINRVCLFSEFDCFNDQR